MVVSTDGQTDRQIDSQTDRQTDNLIPVDPLSTLLGGDIKIVHDTKSTNLLFQ